MARVVAGAGGRGSRPWWVLLPQRAARRLPRVLAFFFFFLLSAFPARDSPKGWAGGFPLPAWESRATRRAGRSPSVPITSYLVTHTAAPRGAGDAGELLTPLANPPAAAKILQILLPGAELPSPSRRRG